jgi:hemoglobin/transferrin/lactoferrin receptor protein
MFTWMEGRVDQPQLDASGNLVFKEDYVSKLQPLTTILGVRYVDPSNWYWAEGLVTLVGKQSKLAYTDREDTGRIPPGGNPGYTVATLRGGIKIGKHLQAAVAFENVFNEEYRVLGSGQNEPGRNLIVTLTGRI